MKKLLCTFLSVSLLLSGCGSGGDTATSTESTPATESTPTTESSPAAETTAASELVINGDYVIPPATKGNPYLLSSIGGGVEPYLYDTLFAFAPNNPDEKFVPHLASSYVQEGNTITITLKEGIKWSDGTPITAQDVANSYYMWVGKKEVWTYLDKIEVLDDKTLKFTFMSESPLMMNQLCDVRISAYPESYGAFAAEYKTIAETGRVWHPETNSYWFTEEANAQIAELYTRVGAYTPDIKDSITSGPFMVKNVTTSEAVLAKNPNFYNDISFETLKIVRVPDPTAAAGAMIDGTLDIHSGGLNADLQSQVKEKVPDYHEFYSTEYSQMSIVFNTQMWPADQLEFRQAMAYLVDREKILPLAEVGSLPSENSLSGLPMSLQDIYGVDEWAAENLTQYTYNLVEAERILTEAGWSKDAEGLWMDETGKYIEFELTCNSGWGSALLPGEAIVNDLNAFGFQVTFRPMDGPSYDSYIRNMEHTVGIEFAPPSNILYAHPYGTYQQLYVGRPWLFGLKMDENNEILVDSPDGGKIDIIPYVNKLFVAQGDELVAATEEIMEITAYNAFFIPYLEKGFPVRTLKSDVYLGYEDASFVSAPEISGVDAVLFSRLIIEGNLYPGVANNG